MKILVYGGNGWIGQQLLGYLVKDEYTLGQARVDDTQTLVQELDTIKPDRVVSLIGRTSGVLDNGKAINSIDYLEEPGKLVENIRDNLFGPLCLAILCQERGIHFTYLGTGCIFNYDKSHAIAGRGYSEEDQPNFYGSAYSVIKGYTDRLMHLFENSVLNLRIRMPISDNKHPRNFITKLTTYQKICNIPNSMTVLSDFLPVFVEMIIQKKTGTFNCTNPGAISHNEILEMYREIVDPNFTWENFSLEEQANILKADRSNNFLDTSKISAQLENAIPNIHTSVRAVLKRYA